MTGLDGRIWTAAWEPDASSWKGWWAIGNLTTYMMTPVSTLTRSANKLDIFVQAADKGLYSAAWQSGNSDWHGWWKLG